jgi:hypothetical protein
MNNTSPEIQELLKRIEERTCIKPKSPADFNRLSDIIWESTHEPLSSSTLKRLWGYFKSVGTIRNSTLVILAQFIGFKGWEDFLAHLDQDNGSDPVMSPLLKTEDLNVGDRITVAWKPNRSCVFRYLGNQKFIVEAASNSKLKAGNTFHCSVFILGAPLYLTDLVQGNNTPVAFVAGKKDGLCEVRKID